MSKPMKIMLYIVSGLVGLLVLIVAGLLIFVDANAYKPQLEAKFSQALGMEVRIEGRLGIGFFPTGVVTHPFC